MSNAEEIRFYVKQLLEDGQPHDKDEMRAYLAANAPRAASYTSGMLAGALYSLVQNSGGRYKSLGGGVYQKMSGVSRSYRPGLEEEVLEVLQNTCTSLENACTINILNLSQQEMAVADKVRGIIQYLHSAIAELRALPGPNSSQG